MAKPPKAETTDTFKPLVHKPYQFQPGQSGNPLGRPKGSRHKLGEAFIAAVYDDFTEHGIGAIEKVREDHPAMYMKILALILPKEIHVKDSSLGEMTDDELADILTVIRSSAHGSGGAKGKRRTRETPGEAGPGDAIN